MAFSIKQKQMNLKHYYGFYKGSIDGVWGPLSVSATKAFQDFCNLSTDGIFGPDTENTSISVWRDIQKKLNENGFSLVLDGLCGNATVNAIKTFQNSRGLVVDGIVGENTMKALLNTPPLYMTEKDWTDIKYFKKEEFKCKCKEKYCDGYPSNILKVLIDDAEQIREHFGKPMIIVSGLRCVEWNKIQGGVSNSRHMKGQAMDFYISGVNANTLIEFAKTLPGYKYAYAITSSNVHLEVCI